MSRLTMMPPLQNPLTHLLSPPTAMHAGACRLVALWQMALSSLYSNSEVWAVVLCSRMVVLLDGLANTKNAPPSALVRPKSVLRALHQRKLWIYVIFVGVLQILIFLFRILINLPFFKMTMKPVSSGPTIWLLRRLSTLNCARTPFANGFKTRWYPSSMFRQDESSRHFLLRNEGWCSFPLPQGLLNVLHVQLP